MTWLSTSRSSLLLPWELIESIIGHSSHPKTISNFSLTCHELRPRSLSLLVANVTLRSRSKAFLFCDFLEAKPHLKPLVRSLIIHPDDFAPIPLLCILPNLSEIKFAIPPSFARAFSLCTFFNQSTLTGCQFLGAHIQSLSLSDLDFKTSIQFLRVLSAFTSITHLVCSNVRIKTEGQQTPLNVAKQRLAQNLHLRTLAITSPQQTPRQDYYNDRPSVGTLLLDSGLVQSTVESLTVEGVYGSTGLPQQFNWSQLRSLALKLWLSSSNDSEIRDGLKFLEGLHHLTLKDVTIEVHEGPFISATQDLARRATLFGELEHALLRFSQVHLVWVTCGFPIGKNSSWVQEAKNRFPVLLQRGALTVVPNTALRTGHTRIVEALVGSPDSTWVASASWDGTIALWNTVNGALVQRWLPYDNTSEISLAFSPNSQSLVSAASAYGSLVIWDIHGNSHRVLEGHTSKATRCAWSPVGDVIASGFEDGTVRLWEANTFQPLHVLEHPKRSSPKLLEFSPDGRWLLTGHHPSTYHIWDVTSGTGRQLRLPLQVQVQVQVHPPFHNMPIVGAFNPASTRFAIASATGAVEILATPGRGGGEFEPGDVREVVLACGGTGEPGREARHVAFSPDGNAVLTVSTYGPPALAVTIWDARTGVELLSLEGHTERIWTARFSPCGKYVAAASWDHTVRLWRTGDGSCVATLSDHGSEVRHIVFSPDRKTLVSGADDGSVIVRRMCDVLPIDERDP